MKQLTLLLSAFLIFLLGVIPLKAQDYKKCVIIETTQGEKLEYYISYSPRFTQDNERVTLTSDIATVEFSTENIKKVYVSEADYKLSYILNGEAYKTYYHHAGVKVYPEADPTKEGYTFSGWGNEPTVMPANDVVVSGSFTLAKYKLIYKVDGEVYKSFEVDYGASITAETAPIKEGYTFSGWSEIPETMPAHDVVVTGTFTINKYNLIYKVDDVVYKSFELDYGTKITPLEQPTKEGYSFSGWSEIPETMPAHDVIVTGTFTKGQFTLTYMVDEAVYKVFSFDFGATITPEPEPQKEGHTFSGWSHIPSTMPAENVVVIGHFTINSYKLTYVVDGEVYKSYEIKYGVNITPEPNPQKEGHTFSGWSWIPTKMPAEDVTITGNYTVNKYKVNYEIDGTLFMAEEIEYGAKIVPPTPPERNGYAFAWGEYPEVMPAHDVTIVGEYTVSSGINKVYASQREMCLSGLQPNENVKVVNTNGITVLTLQTNADGELTIALNSLPTGVYIVKTNRQTFKVTRK